MEIVIMNLVKDGYLVFDRKMVSGFSVGVEGDKIYKLTEEGRVFIQKWISASEIE